MRLSTELLLAAYSQGIFPMADDDGQIYWYDPDPRAILPLDRFHVPRSLQRSLRHEQYAIQVDTAFRQVIEACAAPAPGREETWISGAIIDAYVRMNRQGYAHSVEIWSAGELVGGLYGVSIGGFFAGESMFSWQRDASKIALYHLVGRLRAQGFKLLDVQFATPHLRRFGVIEIPRLKYKMLLKEALSAATRF